MVALKTAAANRLSVERIFSSPPLNGSPPVDLRFSPDDRFVTYRAAAPDDRERDDLYKIDLTTGERTVWIDARSVAPTTNDVTQLTAAERAERERRRDFSYGVTQYAWRPHHQSEMLLPVNGQAYLANLGEAEHTYQAVCPTGTRQSSFQFAPDGKALAYVRDRDIYVLDIAQGQEQRLTRTASTTESFGLPDLLAAEEMHRFQGYWWHENSEALFYTRVDESPVEVSYRVELDANGAESIAQRYPFAGQPNPLVELWYQQKDKPNATCLWSSNDTDEYLARVIPIFDGVLILTQDRRQKLLRYLWQGGEGEFSATQWREVFVEASPTWVNLTDDARACGNTILTTDEVNGGRHAVLVDLQGEVQRLTGPTHINKVLACSERGVFVTGWQDTPLENHLFRLDTTGGLPEQLTTGRGWHEVTLNHKNTGYVDRYTDAETMLSIRYVDLHSDDRTLLHDEKLDAGHPYAPFLERHAAPSFGTLASTDGQSLYYRLTPPADIQGKHPVIVYVYGGPGAQKVRHDWGSLIVQLFASEGFGVLELDNRGSANRGRLFEAPLYKSMGTVEIEDQVAGLTVLSQHSWADVERVGIYGHSYGGYMTLMCLTQAPQAFRAGVAVAPVCDWRLYDSHYTERFMGLPQENTAGYEHGNVLNHLNKLEAPLLLMHGMADDNVLFQNSTMIMNRLQELQKSFELMTYPGAKHSMQEQHVSVHRFNLILDFFRNNL